MSWRDILKVHPAAELFPLMSPDELKALGEDIKKNGLKHDVVALGGKLIDGRNRLDSMEAVGLVLKLETRDRHRNPDDLVFMGRIRDADNNMVGWCKHETKAHVPDPYAYVVSANIHRRHLNGEQKRELIEKLLKATPERSDRATAAIAKVSDKTVAAVRDRLEQGAEIPHQRDRVGKDGVAQPATKKPVTKPSKPKPAAPPTEPPIVELPAAIKAAAPLFRETPASRILLNGIKANWPFLTTEEKAEFLVWVHEDDYELYHQACKDAAKAHRMSKER